MRTFGSSAAAALLSVALASAGCGGGGSGGGVIPSATVTLADVQTQVFSPRCALSGCHAGSGAPFGLDLSSGAAAGNLIDVASAELPSLLRVEPGDAANSYLYMKVSADPRINGDPMPLNRPPLNAADLELIEAWINQGAH